ncbi:hypothetical protein N658DRAFT_493013 [Parathielavia hyrcaniae]|uniref:Uncharacterized protein n=1 Tax=Parathielavia hyrcaniae TaxID=113614 RepID=A0AAN6T5K6_9PEZI|nr:hypothetical protein N658DRAFT_493013 [Parathielavia hyrcaniae]
MKPGEKAREQKDRAVRDAQNQQYAGSAYQIPDPDDFALDDGGSNLSGLPWGGISMRHVVARGHASASASPHTHSHHSGHSGHTGGSSLSAMHTPGPAPVDQALYQMNPYGYAAHPGPDAADMDLELDVGLDQVYGGGYDSHSPYAEAYYDYDAAGSGDGSHGM